MFIKTKISKKSQNFVECVNRYTRNCDVHFVYATSFKCSKVLGAVIVLKIQETMFSRCSIV